MNYDPKFLTDHSVNEMQSNGALPSNAEVITYDNLGRPVKVPSSVLTGHTITRGAMRLATPTDHSFNDASYTVVDMDTVAQQSGDLSVDISTNSITVNKDGVYKVSLGVDAGFGGQEELQLMVHIDGVEYSQYPMAIQGRGANKPVSIFWENTVNLSAGDTLDLRGKNGDIGSFTLHVQRATLALEQLS